jgi:flagellar biosynthetic protein FlhB
MAEQDEGEERTEQPSARRLEEARKQGQLPRSRELSTFMVMLAASGGLLLLGRKVATELAQAMRAQFGAIAQPPAAEMLPSLLGTALWQALKLCLPLFGLLTLAAALAPLALGGWNFAAQAFQPQFSRLDPLKGLSRIFSTQGLVELGKSLLKVLIVGGAGALIVWQLTDELMSLSGEAPPAGMAHAADLCLRAFLWMSGALAVIALADVPYQLWHHHKQLRMTRQELREEAKESEGRPEVKGRIRQLQREISRRRMLENVPRADVVITNPTHVAVALRYDPHSMQAPLVVAKGAELMAAKIREIATAHQVPLLEAPPLARAIYQHAEIDQPIPLGLYTAVAQVLAYVYQLKHVQASGQAAPPIPEPVVPKEYQVEPSTLNSED